MVFTSSLVTVFGFMVLWEPVVPYTQSHSITLMGTLVPYTPVKIPKNIFKNSI